MHRMSSGRKGDVCGIVREYKLGRRGECMVFYHLIFPSSFCGFTASRVFWLHKV